MKEVKETLYDDLAWKQSEEKMEANETVEFSIDGQDVVIDLTGQNAEMLREMLRPFVEAGTPAPKKVGGRKKGATASSTSAIAPKKTSTPAKGSNEENVAIREWAARNGFDLSPRGRIPQDVKDAWAAAQHGKPQGEVTQDRLTDAVPAEPAFDAVADDGGSGQDDAGDAPVQEPVHQTV
jgi:hypothetical protein